VTGSRWSARSDVPRGADYQARFDALAAAGTDVHGEAGFVDRLVRKAGRNRARILDAGCGTGRVGIELARRGHEVVGTDLDPAMLSVARAAAPELAWVEADLASLALGENFDAVVLAGNVMIFVAPGSEPAVVATCSDHLVPGGLLVAGFQVRPGGYGPDRFDRDARSAGLDLVGRWATWDGDPHQDGADYQVSVHARVGSGPTGRR
jgi:2-polyprenyl-3-methyl-5-hydroxy-6-metoxy-1,4-benzoquinol methylase